MEPEWSSVKELFWAALERDPGERDAFLRNACGGNESLRAEVESLLTAHARSDSFLESRAFPSSRLTSVPLLGRRLGPYELVREIGQGGMATVFLAERADGQYRKRVAVKLVREHAGADQILRRFRTERQALAGLDHPNIVKLLDGGSTEEGLPYLVMEFVEGLPFDQYCDNRSLSIPPRLELFRAVCGAVEYAHAKLVIHRDLKPGNILVSADGTPKLLDFGIAKVLSPAFSLETLAVTRADVHPMTPHYASPEQVRGDPITVLTDVYSLGVVLFELLTGHDPYPQPIRTPQELVRAICESEPQWPSRVVTQTSEVRGPDGETRMVNPERISASRGGDPDKLRHLLHGDLDHILLKALRKEPEQRYQSVAELSDDIRRHLAGLPVAARRGTLRYRSGKFVRRHRTEVGAAALVLLAGLGAIIGGQRYGAALEQRLRSHLAASSGRNPTAAAPARLAVLPFENRGRPEDAYVAEGITDEVRGKLAALPGLQVIAPSSSGQYRESRKAASQISEELGVQYLLTATVRWETSPQGTRRVRVSPELIRVAKGEVPTTQWAQPFDAAWSDLFQVQTDIATRVAQALGVALGTGAQRQLARHPTQNLAAYEAFLRAEAAKQASDPVSLRRALPYYEQAVALDTGFVLAWEQLARAHSIMYANGTPSAAEAEAARQTAERTLALAPGRPEGHLARGIYYGAVVGDHARALEEYTEAARLAPGDAEPLFPMATDEMSLGRWDSALEHLRQAERLDPRSSRTPWLQGYALLWLRRYPEALQAYDRGLSLAPASLSLITGKAMVFLAQGDLGDARAVLSSAPKEVDPAALIALMTQYYELEWVLEDPQQTLLLRLTASDFDGDRGVWGLVLARTYALRGDHARARAYADSARRSFEEQLQVAPESPDRHAFLGLALAHLGRKTSAIHEGQRAVALLPVTKDAYVGPDIQRQLARIYIIVGEPEKALDQLEPLLTMPYYLSPGWLSIDPNFDPLRSNPRFVRLTAPAPDSGRASPGSP